MKRTAIIPMRGGSKGILRKNLHTVGGLSLAERAIRSCLEAGLDVIVSTDDSEIAEVSIGAGAKVLNRPAILATDESSSDAVVRHAIEEESLESHTVGLIQATSPFIDPDDLRQAFDAVESGAFEVAFSAKETHGFDWTFSHGDWIPYHHPSTYRPRRQELEPRVTETGAFYVFSAHEFLKAGYRFFGRKTPILVESSFSIDIDDTGDLHWANLIAGHWSAKKPKAVTTRLGKITHLFYDFDGVQTDNTVMLSEAGVESVRVSRADGQGVEIIRRMGLQQVIVSTEANPVVQQRASKLGVECAQNIADKGLWLAEFMHCRKLTESECLFVGNDVNDLPARPLVGLFVAVNDAHPSVKAVADLILSSSGGDGAIRELANILTSTS